MTLSCFFKINYDHLVFMKIWNFLVLFFIDKDHLIFIENWTFNWYLTAYQPEFLLLTPSLTYKFVYEDRKYIFIHTSTLWYPIPLKLSPWEHLRISLKAVIQINVHLKCYYCNMHGSERSMHTARAHWSKYKVLQLLTRFIFYYIIDNIFLQSEYV